jgi:ribokinase
VAGVVVVGVGDLMVDVVVVPEGPLAHGSDTPSTVRTVGGGSAANTACWLASLGRTVALVSMVGDDLVGQAAVGELAAAGVTFAGVADPRAATGTCVVLVDETGERTMLPDRGANNLLSEAVVAQAIADGPTWVHVSGYTLLGDGSRTAGRAALAAAREAGIRTSVDASSSAPLGTVGPERFLKWIDGVDVLFANDDEVAALGGASAVAGRVGALVAKHGPDGASWVGHEGQTVARGASAATVVVDTVGAGDAFDAGCIGALLRGDEPPEVLRAGADAAALALARQGGRPG